MWVATAYAKCGDTSEIVDDDAMSEALDLMDRHNVPEAILLGDCNGKVTSMDWKDGGHPCTLKGRELENMPKSTDRNGEKLLLMCSERRLILCNLATATKWRQCTTYTHTTGDIMSESLLD